MVNGLLKFRGRIGFDFGVASGSENYFRLIISARGVFGGVGVVLFALYTLLLHVVEGGGQVPPVAALVAAVVRATYDLLLTERNQSVLLYCVDSPRVLYFYLFIYLWLFNKGFFKLS